MKTMIMLTLALLFTACNGGGGSGSGGGTTPTGNTISGCMDSSATNYDSTATVSNGSCTYTGTDGQASYYGFSTTSSTPITNNTNPPTDATANIINAGEFYAKINNASARLMDVAIYQPTCLLGSDYAYYSALNMNGDANNANAISLLVTANTVTVYKHKFNIAGRTRFDEGTATTLTGSCSNGQFVLDGSLGSIFSNGKMLVARIDDTLFVGVKSTLQITSTSTAFQFTAYNQTDNDTCNLSGCISGNNTVGSFSSPDAYDFTNGAMTTYFGNGTLRLYTVGGGLADTSHAMLEGSGNYAPTLIADIGSKKVILSSIPATYDCTGTSPNYCLGGVGVIIGIK